MMNRDSNSVAQTGVGLVLCSVLGIGIGQSLTFAMLAPLGREIGLIETQVGLIITCSSLVFSLASPVWGRASDRWGRRPVILIGQFGYAFGMLLFTSMFLLGFRGVLSGLTLYLAIVLSRVLMAGLMSASPGTATAYIADSTSAEQRVAGMGRIAAARNLGTVIGPSISGFFAVLGLLAPLYIAAGITLVFSVVLALYLREPERKQARSGARVRLRFFDRRYRSFLLYGLTAFIAFSMMSQTIGFYIQDTFRLDGQATARDMGFALMTAALSALFAQTVLVRRLGLKPRQLLRVGFPILLVGFALLVRAGSLPLLMADLGLLGLGIGLVAPGFTAGASLAVGPDEQGGIGGLVAACPSGGFVFGPILGTALYRVMPSLPYLCSSLLMVVLTLCVWCRREG